MIKNQTPAALHGGCSTLRISYDEDEDFLWALAPGEVIDGQMDDETEELEDDFFLYRRGPDGPVIGFGIDELSEFDAGDDSPVWNGPRFGAPTLALREATPGEIILAARATLRESTPDVLYFDLAVWAKSEENDLELAESCWRSCLAAGEMKAHFGLGYTLCDLARHREAYGHLRMYTEITPRNSWAWMWLGVAAEGMGEHGEAGSHYAKAIELEKLGSYETDAQDRLDALEHSE